MMMVNKEDLIEYLVMGYLRMSRHDLRFVKNLHNNILLGKFITTNQEKLFNNLIVKYTKQLKRMKIDINLIINLPWKTNIVSSDPKYTEAKIWIEKEQLFFYAPFNKKFIIELRAFETNDFIWDSHQKRYYSMYSIRSLRHIVTMAKKHYAKVNYCPLVLEKLNELTMFGDKYWNPTLVKIKNNYFILASNENLDKAINNFPLNKEPKTIANLIKYGIRIDGSVLDSDPLLIFASEYILHTDSDHLGVVFSHLSQLDCKGIVLHPFSKDIAAQVSNQFGISISDALSGSDDCVLMLLGASFLNTMRVQHNISKYMKIIILKNSNKVQI